MLAQLGGGLGWHRGGAADGDTVPVIWAACGSNGANHHPRGRNTRSDLSRRSGMWWPEPMWGCRLVCQVAVTAPGQSGGAAARFRGVTRPSVHRRACRRRCGSSRKLLKALENLRPPHVPLSVVVLPGMGNCYRFVEGPRPSRDHRKSCETLTRKKKTSVGVWVWGRPQGSATLFSERATKMNRCFKINKPAAKVGTTEVYEWRHRNCEALRICCRPVRCRHCSYLWDLSGRADRSPHNDRPMPGQLTAPRVRRLSRGLRCVSRSQLWLVCWRAM